MICLCELLGNLRRSLFLVGAYLDHFEELHVARIEDEVSSTMIALNTHDIRKEAATQHAFSISLEPWLESMNASQGKPVA